jgi:uncharacterized membrane protein YbhN (UPF0104 family)
MRKFLKDVLVGCAIAFSVAVLVLALRFFHERNKKIYEYMKAQQEIQAVRNEE